MPRIAGVNIPDNKRVEIGLSYIYGLGVSNSQELLKKLHIDGNPKFSELTDTQVDLVRNHIEKDMTVEGDLKQMVQQNIRRLKDIASYRGHRHARNLPVHGQRTKTNARTKRGARKTMGTGRKIAEKK